MEVHVEFRRSALVERLAVSRRGDSNRCSAAIKVRDSFSEQSQDQCSWSSLRVQAVTKVD